MLDARVWSLGWEDPLEEEMPTHCSVPAWRTPWTGEPGGLQSVGSQSDTTERLTRSLSLWGRQRAVSGHGWGVRARHHGGTWAPQAPPPGSHLTALRTQKLHEACGPARLRQAEEVVGTLFRQPRASCRPLLTSLRLAVSSGASVQHIGGSEQSTSAVVCVGVPFKVLWGEGDWGKPGEEGSDPGPCTAFHWC